jgi:thiamine-monophosphate kinase
MCAARQCNDGRVGRAAARCRLGCAASKCGAAVDLDKLPPSRAYIAERGGSRCAPWRATGGDDYSLLAALPPDFDPLSLSLPSRTILACIGTLIDGDGLKLSDAAGEVPLPEQLGYEHRRI